MKKLFTFLLGLMFMIAHVQAQYCLPIYAFDCSSGDYIDGVVFGAINNVGTGCASSGIGNYSDYTNLTATVQPTMSYPISLVPCPTWSQGFGVWIDFNQNQSFGDPGEFVYASPTSGTATVNGNITIPPGAFPGMTRMRVLCKYAGVPTATEYCSTTLSFGETEDYSVMIGTPSPDDMGVTLIYGVSSGCGLGSSMPISININNFGSNAQSNFTVSYSINGGAPVTELINATIPGNTSVAFTFATPANLANPGNYVIQAWTNLPNDGFTGNDMYTLNLVSILGVNTYPYYENFDTGPNGWQSGGSNNTWALGTPAKSVIVGASSAPNAWVNGGLTGAYQNNDKSYVIGPCFDFTSLIDPVFRGRIWWEAESGWDGARLESSIDNGTTWQQVGAWGDPFNWYQDNSINGLSGFGSGGLEGWSGYNGSGSGGWLTCKHDLTGLGGQPSVRLRIAFGSDGSVTGNGFAFDDIEVYDKPANDISMQAFIQPLSTSCGSSAGSTVEVTIQNEGTAAQSNIPITVDIQGFASINTVYPGPLAPGTAANVIVGTFNNAMGGTFILTAHVDNPGDAILTNDTLGFVTVVTPEPITPQPKGNLVCTPDSMLLLAGPTPANLFYWYDAPTAGTLLAVNDSFWTPVLAATTTYYVEARNNISYHVGPTNNGFGPGFYTTSNFSLTFTVNNPITLDSVLVYANSSAGGNLFVSISPFGGGAINGSPAIFPINPGNGQIIQVPVGIALAPGNYNLTMSLPGGTSLFYNYNGATFPYTDVAGNVSITSCSAGTNAYAPAYDWVFTTPGCASPRVPVVAALGSLPNVTLGPDSYVCGPYTLDATYPTGASYSWNTNESTATIVAGTTGLYWVIVTDTDGCIGTDSVTVNVLPAPAVNLGPDLQSCSTTVTLDPGTQPTGSVFQWSNNAGSVTSQTATVSNSGNYYVMVTTPNGCTGADTVNVAMNAVSVNLGPDILQCNNNPINISAGNIAGASFLWSPSAATTPYITVTSSGTYAVLVTKGNCSAQDQIQVTFASPPVVNLGPDKTICGPTVLDAGNPGATYVWSNGATTQTTTVTTANSYSVMVTAPNGCSSSDIINVGVATPASANLAFANVFGGNYNFFATNVAGTGPFTYTWNFGDGGTSNLQNPSHNYTANGTYTVMLTIHNICGDQVYSQTLSTLNVGIEDEIFAGSVTIYPNPSDGIFAVQSENIQADNLSIDLYNVQGQQISHYALGKVVSGFNQEINISSMAKGIYFVKISDGVRNAYKKVVVE